MSEVTQPGIYEMDEATYHRDPVPGGSLSSTGARKLLPPSCPARFRYEQDHPVQKDVFDFGTAAHKLVLGAGPNIACVEADDWRTTKAKEVREAIRADGGVPLLRKDYETVQAMADAIREHPITSAAFSPKRGGQPERSLFWQNDGIWKRARIDWLPEIITDHPIVFDYKSTASAEPASIAKSVANFGYAQQADFYLEGVQMLTGAYGRFIFIFQEKTAPYLVTVCELDPDAIKVGRELNARAAEIYRDCTESGIWPDYTSDPSGIELISLPRWFRPMTAAEEKEDIW